MGLLRTIVYVTAFAATLTWWQTRDSIENMKVPEVGLPTALSRNNVLNTSWLIQEANVIKDNQFINGAVENISDVLSGRKDAKEAINIMVDTTATGTVNFEKAMDEAVTYIDNVSRETGK